MGSLSAAKQVVEQKTEEKIEKSKPLLASIPSAILPIWAIFLSFIYIIVFSIIWALLGIFTDYEFGIIIIAFAFLVTIGNRYLFGKHWWQIFINLSTVIGGMLGGKFIWLFKIIMDEWGMQIADLLSAEGFKFLIEVFKWYIGDIFSILGGYDALWFLMALGYVVYYHFKLSD